MSITIKNPLLYESLRPKIPNDSTGRNAIFKLKKFKPGCCCNFKKKASIILKEK
jgi:hypothetical protein